jgi:hypothetical protein
MKQKIHRGDAASAEASPRSLRLCGELFRSGGFAKKEFATEKKR